MEGDVNKLQAYRSNIISVTEEALNNNVTVYWVSRPILNLLIANAESPEGDVAKWVKLETYIPYKKANERPSYIINKTEYPNLYDRFVKSFNAMILEKNQAINLKENKEVLSKAKMDFGFTQSST